MNSTLMDILENPENYNADQRKIAVKQALGLLDDMAEKESHMALPPNPSLDRGVLHGISENDVVHNGE